MKVPKGPKHSKIVNVLVVNVFVIIIPSLGDYL